MQGWECPKCGGCYAPSVTECHRCVPPTVTVSSHAYIPGNAVRYPWCAQCGRNHESSTACGSTSYTVSANTAVKN